MLLKNTPGCVSPIIRSLVLLLFTLMGEQVVYGQWVAPYANSWINYSKPYVKIGVNKKGLHKIPFSSLPKGFSTSTPEKLQLWRRGKQVAILSTTNNEILFYGLPNDGASDSLLYRPSSSRINPYSSLFSDEGSYFLTNGDAAGLRSKVVNQAVDAQLQPLAFHEEKLLTLYQTDYSLSTQYSIRPNFFNSYYELGASKTGKTFLANVALTDSFTVANAANNLANASIKVLFHGRSDNKRNVEIYVGKSPQSLRLVASVGNNGFEATEYTFSLKPEDINAQNKGYISLKTVGTDRFDRFSLAYYSVLFPQQFNMTGRTTKEFRLVPASGTWSRIQLVGAPANAMLLDITDENAPSIIQGSVQNLMVPRTAGKQNVLLATNEITTVLPAKIKEVSFSQIPAKDPNYIIITSANLLNGARQYAEYRSSPAGGGFKTIVVDVADLYDQYNFGEPSPVAIRKFMAYMLNEGGKDKYLFLIGKSITHFERMKRELPDEVPTIGYPASDMLLVDGLAGTTRDIPAVPVGRLSALSNQNVTDYLNKVKEYEHSSTGEYGWRKKVLHLNGGKNVGEITQLKGLLNELVPDVVNGVIGGKVVPYVKQQAMAEVESVNITPDVNEGAGLITYFGHGSATITDLDMGYITDVARGYNNPKKYPMMYFNGCGVGNIFSARFNPSPTASDRITLSLDWLIAPNRGAIAVIANSFESFVGPASTYLSQLYQDMFVNPATVNLSIGKIQGAVASEIISKSSDRFNIANVHQSLLQGDPALKLITVDKPDYMLEPNASLSLHSQAAGKTMEASDTLRAKLVVFNQGRFVKGQKVPVKLTYIGSKGTSNKTEIVESFPYGDTLSFSFANTKDLQRLEAQVDPLKTVAELRADNNFSELDVDWEEVKNSQSYSTANIVDLIPPVLTVHVDGRLIKQDEVVSSDPEIGLLLRDDRLMLPDTALIELYIKACGDETCDFSRVVFKSGNVRIDSLDSRSFQLNYLSENLAEGTYEILVNAKDRAGNSLVTPYRIRFKISGASEAQTSLIVSPNPASSYFRFELKASERLAGKTIQYLIYNQTGTLVDSKDVTLTTQSVTSEWFWMPLQLSPGLYSYRVNVFDSGKNNIKSFSGKLALIK